MAVQIGVVTADSSEEEFSDYDFSDEESTPSEYSEGEEESGELEEELLGLSLGQPPQVSWKGPITGVSVTVGRAGEGPPVEEATPSEIILELEPTSIEQPISPQVPPSPQYSTVGRLFILRYPSGMLDAYGEYFTNIGGRYQANLEGGPGWTFAKGRENDVRNLVNRIITGELPPPSQLPIPPVQPSIESAAAIQLPTQPSTAASPAQIFQLAPGVLPEPTPPRRKQVQPPAQAIQPGALPMMAVPGISPQPLGTPTITGQAPAQLPIYDPIKKEPGESGAEYQRRIQLYNMLLQRNVPSQVADTLARMRNNVDIHGVTYNADAMRTLNAYLPIQ